MRKFTIFGLLAICLLFSVTSLFAQTRAQVDVPKVDPAAITIDGNADEAEWNTAAAADVVTPTGFNGWFNYYGRPDLTEPDYIELWSKMLWAKDTLFVFIHIKDMVNDSTGLYWNPDNQWSSDQLFVGISSRLGREMQGWYDGNIYAAPEGPYHFLILGERVTLNNDAESGIPEEYQRFEGDTTRVFNASDIARYVATVDSATGVWEIEMAIYNPNVAAGANLGFNFGGSQSSATADANDGDAYAYWSWQPNKTDEPFAIPDFVLADTLLPQDPGGYMLINSQAWALLNFTPGPEDLVRTMVTVPRVDPAEITIDGILDEPEWDGAAKADVVTSTGFDGWFNYYGRDVTEPDYIELYGRMLWATDTLFVAIHIKDMVNDSTGLYWNPDNRWASDQLFVGLSSRLGLEMDQNYQGNVYAAPEGPYHFLVLGDRVTLNEGVETSIPEEWMKFPDDTTRVFDAATIARSATSVDEATGDWNIELAVYNPNVAALSKVGFNFGGSQSSSTADANDGDAYAYWSWQPNKPDEPFAIPDFVLADTLLPQDPGGYMLINSQAWALLWMDTTAVVTAIGPGDGVTGIPEAFVLGQNYPNPFNPSTTIQFALPRSAKVELKVYNLLGQQVATLVNGQYAAGRYEAQWNATRLASGLYFYRLSVDNNIVDTKKMMLLK